MTEKPVKWYQDSAARFLELLKVNDWNIAVRKLRGEKERQRFNELVKRLVY